LVVFEGTTEDTTLTASSKAARSQRIFIVDWPVKDGPQVGGRTENSDAQDPTQKKHPGWVASWCSVRAVRVCSTTV
jgi:hypothetical protein